MKDYALVAVKRAPDEKFPNKSNIITVSYTHLDVYKRQGYRSGETPGVFHNRRCRSDGYMSLPGSLPRAGTLNGPFFTCAVVRFREI